MSETKDKEKAAVIVKVDTPKTTVAKLKTGLEIDTLNIAEFNFKFLKKNAHASYYHNKFNGRRTASGKRFDNNGYTAAHKKLPFGTFVKVTNEANGKFVIVEITDRGPFSKVREIDLSRRAFMDIASNKNSGMVLVTLEIIEPKK
ncbi:septal ring lytic transglycosylase RlpA family protein [Flavobacterium sp. WG47]|nr:septal ring lytic transglycosylase RlpA family protein [Flavobacterium sp. WG47]